MLIATSIFAFITLMLLRLFSQSQSYFQGQSSRSAEMRMLGKAMRHLSEKLSQGSVYLLKPVNQLTSPDGSTEFTVEQFFQTYHTRTALNFSFANQTLVENDYECTSSHGHKCELGN